MGQRMDATGTSLGLATVQTARPVTHEARPTRHFRVHDEMLMLIESKSEARKEIQRSFEASGFPVIGVATPTEGVDIYRYLGRDIKLVMVNFDSEEIQIWNFLQSLRQVNPLVKVVILGGSVPNDDPFNHTGRDVVHYPIKSVDRREFVDLVEALLGK